MREERGKLLTNGGGWHTLKSRKHISRMWVYIEYEDINYMNGGIRGNKCHKETGEKLITRWSW